MGVGLRHGRIAIRPISARVIEHHDAGQMLKAACAVGPQATRIEAGKTAALRMPGQEYVLAAGLLLHQGQHPVDIAGIGFKVPIRDKRQIALLERPPGRTGAPDQRPWRRQGELAPAIQREAAIAPHDEAPEIVFNRALGVCAQDRGTGTGGIRQVGAAALDDPHFHTAIRRAQAIPAPAFAQVGLVQQLGAEIQPVCRRAGKPRHRQNDGMRFPGMLTIQRRTHTQEGGLVQIGRCLQGGCARAIPAARDLDRFANDIRIVRQAGPIICMRKPMAMRMLIGIPRHRDQGQCNGHRHVQSIENRSHRTLDNFSDIENFTPEWKNA